MALSVNQVANAIALAALVFSGLAADQLGRAIPMFILGTCIVSMYVGWRTQFEVIVAGAKNNVTVILAALGVTVAADAAEAGESFSPGATVAVFFLIATVSCSLVLFIVGRLRLGHLVRYVPHPVMSGFIAGTALLMFRGSLALILGYRVGLGDIAMLFEADTLARLAPAFALALLMVFGGPATLRSVWFVVAVVAFHLITAMTSSIGAAEDDGWLLGPLPDERSIQPIPDGLANVNWPAIAAASPGIIAVTLIGLIGLMLNTSSVEFATGESVDVDHELEISGSASLLASLLGGTIGFIGIGQALLARRLGATSKLVASCALALGVLAIVAGPAVIELMPRFVAGAMILAPAVLLFRTWWRESMTQGAISDRAIALIIPVAIGWLGVIEGIALGVAAAVGLFVWRYASVNPVRFQTSAATMHSNVDRPPSEQAALAEVGSQIAIVGVEGFLFFGSMTRFASQLRAQIADDPSVRSVVIDFSRSSGFDSSAVKELNRLLAWCDQRNVAIELSGGALNAAALHGQPTIHDDRDRAIEAAENALLELHGRRTGMIDPPTGAAVFGDELAASFREFRVEPGTELIVAGRAGESLYLVLSGAFTVWADVEGNHHRIRQILAGSYLGEISFFSHQLTTGTVIADAPSTVLRLTRSEFAEIERTRPDLALHLTKQVLDHTNRRLASTTGLVRDLLR